MLELIFRTIGGDQKNPWGHEMIQKPCSQDKGLPMNESVLISPRSQLKRHANICQPCPEIVQRNTDHLILVLHFSHFTALFVLFCARGWSFNIHWCGTWGVAGWTVKVLQRCVSFNRVNMYIYICLHEYRLLRYLLSH